MTLRSKTKEREPRHVPKVWRTHLSRMASTSRKTLLEPGHEDEWAKLNLEKARPDPVRRRYSGWGLLAAGRQHLSAQAAGLLRAVERGQRWSAKTGARPSPAPRWVEEGARFVDT